MPNGISLKCYVWVCWMVFWIDGMLRACKHSFLWFNANKSAMLLLSRLYFNICGRIYNKLDPGKYDWVSRCIKSAFWLEIYTIKSGRVEIKSWCSIAKYFITYVTHLSIYLLSYFQIIMAIPSHIFNFPGMIENGKKKMK